MLDFLVTDVEAIDGMGKRLYFGNIGIRDGRLLHNVPSDTDSNLVVSGQGKLLVPGFIDMHAHADLSLITGEASEAKIRQGVTTQVIGQDGLGYAPTTPQSHLQIVQQISGWNGPFPKERNWNSIQEFSDDIDREGASTNGVILVPHGNLRLMVVGVENRAATQAEIARMCRILEDALADGARGLSAGLTYTPGAYADVDELTQLCKVVTKHGGYFSPHTRSYGLHALPAYQEMIDVARASGVHLHLTHATMNFEVNRGRAEEFLSLLDRARREGISVSLDSYPYTPGATSLVALLPSWVFGNPLVGVLDQLKYPTTRSRIQFELDTLGSDGAHGCVVDWDSIEISGVSTPELDHFVGRTVLEISKTQNKAPSEVAMDIITQDSAATTILMHVGWEENIIEIMKDPLHCVSSDGITVGSKPHPRAWGSFTRFLQEYVLERKIMPLPDAIKHMAGNAASVLGWESRGSLHDGAEADIALLNLDTLEAKATFDKPTLPSTGVDLLLINGHAAVVNDSVVNSRAGRVIS